ncbi:isoleucine--tRNA ligase [Candidatus Microgenomates bacterium]|nr:isoleucine--tRNA ligase [Candidatus Microgenomates bacterium]
MAKKSKNGSGFEPVAANPDFPKMEQELMIHWYEAGIFKKYLAKNSKSKKLFRFLDGPITANNPMGVHHGWGRTYKDVWQRYKNMQGFKQRFQNGFDAQGLWVEVNVEKELGLKSKQDIENLVKGNTFASIAKFVELCKERVRKFSAIQTDQSKRLGYFMDWDNSYNTMSDENNYMIWHFLKVANERGLIYEGVDSVPWCPRCATAISNHEILTEGYKELTHTAVTVKYPIVGRNNEYLLVWTTTPWTLPANVAIAVNPKLIYSRVKVGNDIYYLARSRIIPVLGLPAQAGPNIEVLEELAGERLVNVTYQSPFDNLPAVQKVKLENPRSFHRVVGGEELVTEEEGTGLVHIAPGAGHEDFVLAKREKLPMILAIDEGAIFLPGFGEFSGKAAGNPRPIIAALNENGFLLKEEQYTHRYPVCWRCETELVFRAVPEWYIAMDPIRNKMTEITKSINWLPEFCRERELDWIRNMDDWMISKKRYWGLALPIWKCQACGYFTVIGGLGELKEKAVEGWKEFTGHSPHKPYIDQVKIACEKCHEIVSRIPDVGNPWLDAGIVPFSTLPKEWFPADFITESFPGQFKGWFYSMLAMSTVLAGTAPFQNVLGHGTVLAEDGRPMHKSWGNAIEFNEGADKIGVDVMRWMYVKQDPAKNLLFGYKIADETRRSFHLPLWNVYNFFVTYATFDAWKPSLMSNAKWPMSNNILDKWILARLKEVVKINTEGLEKYEVATGAIAIENFVQDLSNWYIRRSRDRVGPSSTNINDKENFYQTTYFVLVTLCRLLAPLLPFMSEAIFTKLTSRESVHLEDWPEVAELESREQIILDEMKQVREAVEAGHAARKANQIRVRQPLSRATVAAPTKSPSASFLELLAEELNVKEVVWKKKRVDKITVSLNTKISPQLLAEGQARELVRLIQEERKRLSLGLTDKIVVTMPGLPKDIKLINWIKAKTMAVDLQPGSEFKVTKIA